VKCVRGPGQNPPDKSHVRFMKIVEIGNQPPDQRISSCHGAVFGGVEVILSRFCSRAARGRWGSSIAGWRGHCSLLVALTVNLAGSRAKVGARQRAGSEVNIYIQKKVMFRSLTDGPCGSGSKGCRRHGVRFFRRGVKFGERSEPRTLNGGPLEQHWASETPGLSFVEKGMKKGRKWALTR